MTDIKSISELITPIAKKYGAKRVALFGSRAKNTSNDIGFLEQIKKDEVVVYEAER